MDGVVPGDFPVEEAGEDLVQGHLALDAGQCGAEAVVDAVAEAQVAADLAVDVELLYRAAAAPVGLPVGQVVR